MAETEPEFIEVVEEVLDNQMALIMLACGIIGGIFLFYLYTEYQKKNVQPNAQFAIPEIEQIAPAEPSLRGQSNTFPQ
jgi:hypothetical protein